MPIYEYRCANCGQILEIMQKFSDKPLTKCPSCSGKLAKLISNCSFHLKGSGWYVTDYKKGDSGWREKSSDKKSETSVANDTPKSETLKSETKAVKSEEKKS